MTPASASPSPVEEPVAAPGTAPLCVDLDGTLLKSDLLFESLLALARTRFLSLLLVPFWCLKGRLRLKNELVKRVTPDVTLLPYRQEVLDWLGREKTAGRKLVLVTGTHERLARAVAEHLGLFDEVIATTATLNLVRSAKRDALVQRFGDGYDYAGDSKVDLPVWASARQAIVVAARPAVERAARAHGNVTRSIPHPGTGVGTVVRAVRTHQWAKNVLLFVPLLTAHRFDLHSAFVTALGAFAFSLCASAVYVANDLIDLESDRRHHSKRNRPFASGALPISLGLGLGAVMLVSGIALAVTVSVDFALVLGLYLVVTSTYTFALKKIAVVDVLCLAALYSLRIFAGGTLVGLPVSDWLIAFSMFFFLSLALVKRAAELWVSVQGGATTPLPGRGYATGDLPIVTQMGVGAGHLSVLVFAVYIQSDTVRELYAHPWALWFVCPLIFLWLGRVWLLAGRGHMHDDPVVFAVRDQASYAIGVLAAATLWLAH